LKVPAGKIKVYKYKTPINEDLVEFLYYYNILYKDIIKMM
jgi:hypothetical protein